MRIILLANGCANCLTIGRNPVDRESSANSSKLFRAFKTSAGDNLNLTKTTLSTIKQNVQNYLDALIDDKFLIEDELYQINLGSQLAVDASKAQPMDGDVTRQDLVLSELYAALKTRCSSGNKLLIADFARRRAENQKAGLEKLTVQNANCKVAMRQPLKVISLVEDVIVAAADEPAQTGELENSSLAIFQDGEIVNSWPVAAIELPIEPILSIRPCFTFQYLGGPIVLCSSSSITRDQWILALTFNIICLHDGIGRGLASPVNAIQSASELLMRGAPNGGDPPTSTSAPAKATFGTTQHASTTTAPTTLPGLYNIFIGITKDTNAIVSAKDRSSLEQELMAPQN